MVATELTVYLEPREKPALLVRREVTAKLQMTEITVKREGPEDLVKTMLEPRDIRDLKVAKDKRE
jgi:hypothetical protein